MRLGFGQKNDSSRAPTVFLYSTNQGSGLERAVTRRQAGRQSKGFRPKAKARRTLRHPNKTKMKVDKKPEPLSREALAKQQVEELNDTFMPQLSDLADFRFRSELMRMMGSDVIRLSDANWSQRLQDSLLQDYERQLDEQMQTLAKEEQKRLHRLRLEGILTIGSTSKSCDDLMKKAFTSAVPSKSPKESGSATNAKGKVGFSDEHMRRLSVTATKLYGQGELKIFANEAYHKRERALAARRTKKSYRPPKELSVLKKPVPEEKSAEEEQASEREDAKKFQIFDLSKSSESFEDFQIVLPELTKEERRAKRYKKLPPQIAKLYDEESVTGLYRLAAMLVGRPKQEKAEAGTVRIAG